MPAATDPKFVEEWPAADGSEQKGKLAMLQGIAMGMMNISGFFTAPIISRLGYRLCGMTGGVWLAGCLYVSSFAPSVEVMMLTYGVALGIGYSLCMMPAFPIAMFWFNKRRGLAASLVVSGSGLGNAVLSPVITAVMQAHGWRVAMRWLALLTLIVCGCVPIAFRLPPNLAKQEQKKMPIDTLIFKDPVFRLCGVCFFFTSFGYFVPFAHNVKLAQEKGLSDEQGALIVAVIGLSNTAGRLLAGPLADGCIGRVRTWQVSLFIGGCAAAAAPFCSPENAMPWLCVCFGLFGYFGGAFVAMFVVLMADFFSVHRAASSIGMAQVVFASGTFVGSPLAGWIQEWTGTYHVSFVIAGAGLAMGGVMMGLVHPYLQHPEHLRQLALFEPKVTESADGKTEGEVAEEGGDAAPDGDGEAQGDAGAVQPRVLPGAVPAGNADP